MGNDGGSIPDRRDLVRSKPKAEQADKANQIRAMWFFCALSKRPLEEPIVSCPLGKLYNKDAILEFLLDRGSFGGEGEIVCGHIRNIKDVKTLTVTPNASMTLPVSTVSESSPDRATFVCPLNFKEMNGSQPFVYLSSCGCVFSQAGLKAVTPSKSSGTDDEPVKDKDQVTLHLCPQCGSKYNRTTNVLALNPSPEIEEEMRAAMEAKRLLEPVKVKGKKRKATAAAADGDTSEPPLKKQQALAATNSNISAASRAVTQDLAKEEAKRKAAMSDAVKSLYAPKDGQQKETFMTMGTFTRYA